MWFRTGASAPPLLQRYQWTTFAAVWLSYAIVYFLRKPLGVIKPNLESDLKVSKTQLGWLDVALLLPYALVQICFSQAGDRVGPRLTISLCLTIAGTAMFTFGMWDSFGMLLFLMFINGAMQGPCWPACCKAVASWYPDSRLNSMIGFLATSVFIGGAAGTALAVQLQSVYGWRMVHVPPGVVAVALGLLIYCVLFTPEERRILIPGKDSGGFGTKIIGEDGIVARKSSWQLLMIPAVMEITLTVLCLKVVRYCMFLWLPMYLVNYLQYSVAHAGLFSTIFDIGGSLGTPLIGLILDRYFKKNTLLGMWIFVVITTVSMGLFALTARWGFIQNAIFMVIAGATNGGTDSLLAGSVSMKIGEMDGMKCGAAVTGLVNGIGTLGAVLEGPIIGYIADNYGWGAVFTFMIILSAVASLSVFRAMIIQRRVDRAVILGEDKSPLIA